MAECGRIPCYLASGWCISTQLTSQHEAAVTMCGQPIYSSQALCSPDGLELTILLSQSPVGPGSEAWITRWEAQAHLYVVPS